MLWLGGPALVGKEAAGIFTSMASRGVDSTADAGDASSPPEDAESTTRRLLSAAADSEASDTSQMPRGLFRSGRRSIHSLKRLKDLEDADEALGTEQERASPSSCAIPQRTSTEAPQEPREDEQRGSDSDDDTLEVVRSMKDLQRMRGGPRKGLDARVALQETLQDKDDEEAEDAVGLLEKNFAAGGPGSVTDKHLYG